MKYVAIEETEHAMLVRLVASVTAFRMVHARARDPRHVVAPQSILAAGAELDAAHEALAEHYQKAK